MSSPWLFFTKTEFHPVVHMESVCHLHIKHNGLVATLFLKGGGQRCTVEHRRWKDSRRILVCQTIKGAFWSWPFVRSNKDRTGGEPLIHWVTVLSEALVGCIMGCRDLWSFSYPDRGLTALFTLSFIYLVDILSIFRLFFVSVYWLEYTSSVITYIKINILRLLVLISECCS